MLNRASLVFHSVLLLMFFSGCSDIQPRSTSHENTIYEKNNEILDNEFAFEISVDGGGMGPDKNFHDRVMNLLGSLVSDQTLAQFSIKARGIEGGGVYCIELDKYIDMPHRMKRVHGLLKELNAPEYTSYHIKVITNCADNKDNQKLEPTNATGKSGHYLLSKDELKEFQNCSADSDCIVVNNGCCNCSNGGETVAINKPQLSNFNRLFDCNKAMCTERAHDPACETGSVKCEANTCVFTKSL